MNSNNLTIYNTSTTTAYIPNDTINSSITIDYADNLLAYIPMNNSDLNIYTSTVFNKIDSKASLDSPFINWNSNSTHSK